MHPTGTGMWIVVLALALAAASPAPAQDVARAAPVGATGAGSVGPTSPDPPGDRTNNITDHLSGEAGVISRWTSSLTGSLPEFERSYILPSRLTLQWLRLGYDFGGPTHLELTLDAPTETDTSARLDLRDLRAFDVGVRRLDWSNFDTPDPAPSRRVTTGMDVLLRRFPDHPVWIDYTETDLHRLSVFQDRTYLAHLLTVGGDFRLDTGALAPEYTDFSFRDRADSRYDTRAQTGRVGFHRDFESGYLGASYAQTKGQLGFFHEDWSVGELVLTGTSFAPLGAQDLTLRSTVRFMDRPDEVIRTAHVRDAVTGTVDLAITPVATGGVNLGLVRKQSSVLHLTREGITAIDNDATKTIPALAPFYQTQSPIDTEGYIRFFIRQGHQFTVRGRYAQGDTSQLPFTNVVAPVSPILLNNRTQSDELKFTFTPSVNFGGWLWRTEEDRRNDGRGSAQTFTKDDGYAWLRVWRRLTIGTGLGLWQFATDRSEIRDFAEKALVYRSNVDVDLSGGLGLFGQWMLIHTQGPRETYDHIIETGLKWDDAHRVGIEGRISLAVDTLDDPGTPANAYRHVSVNVGGTLPF